MLDKTGLFKDSLLKDLHDQERSIYELLGSGRIETSKALKYHNGRLHMVKALIQLVTGHYKKVMNMDNTEMLLND